MKIEWFVQYYYSAEDVYKAKKMQWLVIAVSICMQLVLMISSDITIMPDFVYVIVSLFAFGLLLWIYRGYEKAKISYRKSMMQCRKEVSEEFKNNWHEFIGDELTWKRDRWITVPQVGLMFVFMVLAILSIMRI